MRRLFRRTRLDELDDDALVARVRDGDEAAFGVIAERHGPWLVALCTRLLGGDRAAAEDVAQETLIKAHATILRNSRPAKLHAWMAVVARHACMDEHRRRRPEPTDTLPDQAVFDEDPFALDPHLEEAWQALLPRHREVLHHRELLGLSYEEISVAMDTTLPAIETLLFRARAALRREYQRAGGALLGCGLLGFQLIRLADQESEDGAFHLASCIDCQEALTNVTRIGDMLRGTAHLAASTPDPTGSVAGAWMSGAMASVGSFASSLGELPSRLLQGAQAPVAAMVVGATLASTAVVGVATSSPAPSPSPSWAPSPSLSSEPRPATISVQDGPAWPADWPSPAAGPSDRGLDERPAWARWQSDSPSNGANAKEPEGGTPLPWWPEPDEQHSPPAWPPDQQPSNQPTTQPYDGPSEWNPDRDNHAPYRP